MRRGTRFDITVILAIIVCCAFLPLHLIGGGATILLCVSVACMAIVVLLTVVKRRWHSARRATVVAPLKTLAEEKVFQSIDQVDDDSFWDLNEHPTQNDAANCVICINSVSGEPKYSKCCHNVFHRECMKAFIFHNQQKDIPCPICRTVVRTDVRVLV
jgi:hypothetical protein